jgi:hypothetical protein
MQKLHFPSKCSKQHVFQIKPLEKNKRFQYMRSQKKDINIKIKTNINCKSQQ